MVLLQGQASCIVNIMKLYRKLYFPALATLLLLGQAGCAVAASPESRADEASEITGVAGAYLSGQFARSQGDIDTAIEYFQRIHEVIPDNAEITRQLQGMLLLQGRIEEANELAQQVNLKGMDDPLSTLLVTLRAIKSNDLARADMLIDGLANMENDQLWVPLIAAWVDLGQGRMEKALTVEDLDMDIARALPLLSYHLALINDQAGFKKAAAANFKQAVSDPHNPPSRVMKSLIAFYEKNGRPETLKSIIEDYRKHHPDVLSAQPVPVVATVQDGVSEVLFTMGGIMFGAGVTNDAAIYLQLALYVKPDFAQAALALGDAYNDLQQYEKANSFYGKVSQASGLYYRAQMHMAVNYDRMGRLDKALELLNLASQSGGPEIFIAKGDLLRIHSRFGEATQAYDAAVKQISELKDRHWPVLFARGSCFERMGQWNEAERDLRQSLLLKPDQPDVLNYLGYALLERGEKIPEARRMIEKAIAARPDDAQIVDSMGWALYLQGEYEKATAYLEKAVELLPSDPTVNDHLGDVYWRVGRKNEARFQWERALAFSPEPLLAENIRKKLKDGLPPTTLANRSPEGTALSADATP